MGYCFQSLFNRVRGILVQFPSSFFSIRLVYRKFICFQNNTLRVLLIIVIIILLYPFFGLNAFLISGIKPLLRTLVRKYAEGKDPAADSVCESTTWSSGLRLPLLASGQDRERTCPKLCLKLTDFATLNFNFEKLNSFFLLLNSH